jgi:HD-like signal output (HDOD) protein
MVHRRPLDPAVTVVPRSLSVVPQQLDATELKTKLLELFRSSSYQPPVLPVVAVELLALTRKPRVDVRSVVELLEKDALLAGDLLKLAQSPLYAMSPIRSLEDAILRLGLSKVSDLFLRASLDRRVFRAPGYDEPMNRLRRHSALTAELVQQVCRLSVGLEQYAFLCGLLHDVGIAASILALSELLLRPPFDVALPIIESIHEGASEVVSRIWKLPPDIGLVLSLHHRVSLDGKTHPVAAAVAVADGLADEVGFGFYGETDPIRTNDARKCLGLDARTADLLRAEAVELARHIT